MFDFLSPVFYTTGSCYPGARLRSRLTLIPYIVWISGREPALHRLDRPPCTTSCGVGAVWCTNTCSHTCDGVSRVSGQISEHRFCVPGSPTMLWRQTLKRFHLARVNLPA